MSLKNTFKILNPKELEMELIMQMSLGDWVDLQKVLKTNPDDGYWHPGNQMVRSIDEVVRKATESFNYYDSGEENVDSK